MWDGIRAENPYKRRHRFASTRTISTPTHCDKALQGTQHCNRAEIVELSISNSFRMHAFDCVEPDCTIKSYFPLWMSHSFGVFPKRLGNKLF